MRVPVKLMAESATTPTERDGEVEAQQVAVGEPVVVRQSVQYGVVDRGADVVAERPAPKDGS